MYTILYQHQPQKRETYAVFSNGFWGIDHRRPKRHWGIIQCNSSNGPQGNPFTLSINSNPEKGAPIFQLMIAKGQLECPKRTIELKFEVGDIEFDENFIVMENLTGPIIGLLRQSIMNFPFFSMQLKSAEHQFSNILEPILNSKEITIPPIDRVLIRTNSLLYPENAVTGILQPSDLLHEVGDITFCPALFTLHDGNIRIPVNNFTDHPYKLKKLLHFANFSLMTPE